MGEIVQKNMELSTPEIIELKASKLFKNSEISILLKRRRHLEYKLIGIPKRVQDFSAAIKYERDLLLELMKRRRARNMPIKRENLDFLIIQRIQSFYSTALVNFSDNYDLHLEYFNFIKQYHTFYPAVTEHVRKMLEKFESNSQVFRVAASWFGKTVGLKEALKILHRGLARHPLDQDLYFDLIDLELKDPEEHKLQERLKKYVDEILKNIPRHESLIDILEMLEDSPINLLDVENYIIDHLLDKFWFEEKVWDKIAVRELNGLYYKASPEEEEGKTTRRSIKRCISRYKEGILKVPSKKQPALWKLYLNKVIDLQKEDPDTAILLRADSLKQALEDAKKANIKLDETHWAAWIDVCGSNDELLLQKLDEATTEQPHSSMLWAMYLKYYILKDKTAQAEIIFKRAIIALGPKAVFIWDMYIDYYLLRSPVSDANELYKKAVCEPYDEISRMFKPRYLTWTVLSNGIKEARELYWEMADKPPYCKELHDEMIQMEIMEHYGRDADNVAKIFELYAKQFGNQDVDVWIQWIKMIRDEKTIIDRNENERQIYNQAIKTLPEGLINDFKDKYNALSYDQF